ncbi:MAG TPA: hypothetical protein VKF38_16910, partial [Anaerolineaceae bacterium]|nr:hypothetical protein [Anaerolineaceae bacterium]
TALPLPYTHSTSAWLSILKQSVPIIQSGKNTKPPYASPGKRLLLILIALANSQCLRILAA